MFGLRTIGAIIEFRLSVNRKLLIKLSQKAVILARGLGTRMRAETVGVVLTPEQERIAGAGIKALMPVTDGKVLLELILENLAAAGFREFCMVIGPEHAAIRDFCDSKDFNIKFAVQSEALGTANAVLAAQGCVAADELFLVVNSDNLYAVNSLRRLRGTNRPAMLAFEREALLKRGNIPADRIEKFATVEIGPSGLLRRIVEKPEQVHPGSFVSMNAWLFSPSIFAACRSIERSDRGEFELTAAVQYAIDKGEEFVAVKAAEGVLDLSSRADIESVSKFLATGP